MVLANSEYNEDYFNGRNTGIRYSWGYADIRELNYPYRFNEGETIPYNPLIKEMYDKLSTVNLSNVSVLDIGGAVGNFAQYGKQLGIQSWTVLDLNINGWCEANKKPEVDNFITGDATVVLSSKQQFKTNSYDIIFTHQFLECIDPLKLPDLITEMNRVGRKQVHIIDETLDDIPSQSKYNLQPLSWWATQGFKAGTVLISKNTGQVTVV